MNELTPPIPPGTSTSLGRTNEDSSKLRFTGKIAVISSLLFVADPTWTCLVVRAFNLPRVHGIRSPICYASIRAGSENTQCTESVKGVDPIWNKTFELYEFTAR
jgi:hypothetical protein